MARGHTAIYARISSDPGGEGLGVARQLEDCRQFATDHEWTDLVEYVDNDRSAFSGRTRPEYQRLVDDISAGRVARVIAWHPDRLHRSPLELEGYLDLVQAHQVDTFTVRAGAWDLSTPAGRLQARVIGSFSRYESEHKSERIARKHRQTLMDGGLVGGRRPFGWQSDGTTVPDELAALAEGTRAILDGRSLASVVRDWNARGLTTTAGRQFDPVATRLVLQRARNAGLATYKGEVVGPGKWEPAVTETEWRGVCAIFSDPARRTSPGAQVRWMGSGLYRCGVCGEAQMRVTYANTRPVYRCKAPGAGGRGRHVTRAAPALDEYVSTIVVARLSMPDAREALTVSEPNADTLESVHREREALNARMDEAGRMYAAGEVTARQLAAITRELEPRLDELDAHLTVLADRSPAASLASADDIVEAWLRADLDTRRAVLDALMTVTILPVGPSFRARPGEERTDIDIQWKGSE